mmetsp:Transcript_7927/g.21435  ORF Transcript_7927/g.21435 Transcript_7927/m.21435 type:complete len:270 (+) Transcript_7927:76-885(+)
MYLSNILTVRATMLWMEETELRHTLGAIRHPREPSYEDDDPRRFTSRMSYIRTYSMNIRISRRLSIQLFDQLVYDRGICVGSVLRVRSGGGAQMILAQRAILEIVDVMPSQHFIRRSHFVDATDSIGKGDGVLVLIIRQAVSLFQCQDFRIKRRRYSEALVRIGSGQLLDQRHAALSSSDVILTLGTFRRARQAEAGGGLNREAEPIVDDTVFPFCPRRQLIGFHQRPLGIAANQSKEGFDARDESQTVYLVIRDGILQLIVQNSRMVQ